MEWKRSYHPQTWRRPSNVSVMRVYVSVCLPSYLLNALSYKFHFGYTRTSSGIK